MKTKKEKETNDDLLHAELSANAVSAVIDEHLNVNSSPLTLQIVSKIFSPSMCNSRSKPSRFPFACSSAQIRRRETQRDRIPVKNPKSG